MPKNKSRGGPPRCHHSREKGTPSLTPLRLSVFFGRPALALRPHRKASVPVECAMCCNVARSTVCVAIQACRRSSASSKKQNHPFIRCGLYRRASRSTAVANTLSEACQGSRSRTDQHCRIPTPRFSTMSWYTASRPPARRKRSPCM